MDEVTAPLSARQVDPNEHGVYDPALLVSAPAPLQRYFNFALQPEQGLISRAHLEHAGEFALKPGRWKPFTSTQEINASPPGFVWDARISLQPLPLTIHVRDTYADGVASSRASLAGLMPLGGQQGTPEVAESALWRYLAEAVWVPTALLPSDQLAWSPIDDQTARATLTDRGATAIAEFHFGPRGEINRITGQRYRAVGGGQVLTPTEGHHRAYARVAGMMIPTEGEVTWLLAEGPHTYWRARVTRATYSCSSIPGGAPGRPLPDAPRVPNTR